VGVIGNHRLEVLPTWELFVDKLPPGAPRIATAKVKWDPGYQEKYDIRIDRAKDLGDKLEKEIGQVSRRIYRRLGLSGYARIDFRLSDEGKLYFLEANPNPDIADTEELASAAEAAGIQYHDLLQKLVSLGLRRALP
jgi:D-alanine-D-alanine ligase